MRREARKPLDPDKNKHENTSGGLPAHSCLKALAVRQEMLAPLAANLLAGSAARAVRPLLTSARIALDTRVLGVEDPGTKLMIRAENHLKVITVALASSASSVKAILGPEPGAQVLEPLPLTRILGPPPE